MLDLCTEFCLLLKINSENHLTPEYLFKRLNLNKLFCCPIFRQGDGNLTGPLPGTDAEKKSTKLSTVFVDNSKIPVSGGGNPDILQK